MQNGSNSNIFKVKYHDIAYLQNALLFFFSFSPPPPPQATSPRRRKYTTHQFLFFFSLAYMQFTAHRPIHLVSFLFTYKVPFHMNASLHVHFIKKRVGGGLTSSETKNVLNNKHHIRICTKAVLCIRHLPPVYSKLSLVSVSPWCPCLAVKRLLFSILLFY